MRMGDGWKWFGFVFSEMLLTVSEKHVVEACLKVLFVRLPQRAI
jgi:hypothetical protein